ncbi:MAG: outer membrane protein assembly factor BamD [Rickettsiales bacterium]|jgi:outer membrane protein assembly factor BamD|nr:outer membrane protein assembly factor BamD [Rickettsiales bacterium]
MKKTNHYLLFLASCLLALVSCAGNNAPTNAAPPALPEMYRNAYAKVDKDNYDEAAGIFLEIESTYPTSKWAADALVMAVYSQYQAERFADALATIDRFMRFHPGHEDAAYMLYIKGMCYYRQVSDVRREPGMSNYAMSAFNQLLQRFPKSEYAKNAKNKIMILKNYIAGKIMYSARRDLARQNYPVAITNLQKIILQMQDTQMTPEAMFRLTEAYAAIGLPEQAAGYAEMLRKNFPESVWTKKLKN